MSSYTGRASTTRRCSTRQRRSTSPHWRLEGWVSATRPTSSRRGSGTDRRCLPGSSEPAEEAERVPGLLMWLESRELVRHLERVTAWCDEMGAADFMEVAENTADLAEHLGDALTPEERERLLRGTR
mmetsp:Transcript_109598/g.341572  ORF Transcript_109598/g.341572 Transcript_109598/m.341572 type:complete len:127 (+) Transcript_109598:593-973(+)